MFNWLTSPVGQFVPTLLSFIIHSVCSTYHTFTSFTSKHLALLSLPRTPPPSDVVHLRETLSHPRRSMQVTNRQHRKSREELRLEQIAIWGDAAYTTRHSHSHSQPQPSSPTTVSQLDLDVLEAPIVAEGLEKQELLPPRSRGSFSMCHSASAELFRRSGFYAAQKRASIRNERRLPDVVDVPIVDFPVHHAKVVVSKRSSFGIGGREYWMQPVSKGRRGRVDEFEEDLFLQTRRESAVIREKDEVLFRQSNAKLPERDDDEGNGRLKRARESMTMLGRYTRTRSSKLPARGILMNDRPVNARG